MNLIIVIQYSEFRCFAFIYLFSFFYVFFFFFVFARPFASDQAEEKAQKLQNSLKGSRVYFSLQNYHLY